MSQQEYIRLHPEVQEAIADGRPVVALETTIITHGMPYPENVETALSVESIIRSHGVVPATICVRNGQFQIGMSQSEIESLAAERGVVKASRRDLPAVLARKQTGSTTVAATMIAARLAGIRVFVTGGIGGVHRGATASMDISADLQELAQTDVIVVCAGAKAILDIGLTLEVLETLGVPVVGYQTDAFPAFYTRDSGQPVNVRVDSAEEVAMLARIKWDLGLRGGVLLANPIPSEAEVSRETMEQAIEKSLREAHDLRVVGKDVTPFLLDKLKDITGGESLQANIKLVEHNAHVGSLVASAL
jgi:pseudouridylate synthase